MKEFTAMHKGILPIILPRLGYQRNFPREIAFGPKNIGGIGCSHYSAVQLSKKVIGIIKHVRVKSKIGRKFMVLMKWAQLYTGVSKPLLQETGPIPHLEGKWLHYIKGKIHITDIWVPTTQQENDKWLMDEFLESN
eukprot:5599724-Ditylum_brightwellii.AAC.1